MAGKKPSSPRPGRKPQIGRCRICGRQGLLTFEHIPAKSAFNRDRVMVLGIVDWLEREERGLQRKGHVQQRGMGDFVLCDGCNNKTGRLYVPELERWTRAAAGLLAGLDGLDEADQAAEAKAVAFRAAGMHPGRFAKQFVAMIMAINGGEFQARNPQLTDFVLDENKRGLPTGYDLYLALYLGPQSRRSGVSGILRGSTSHLVSELAHAPLAYVMSLDEKPEAPALPAGKVSHFADYGLDEKDDLDLELMLGFGHTPLPIDYRSAKRVELDRKQNQAEAAGLGGG